MKSFKKKGSSILTEKVFRKCVIILSILYTQVLMAQETRTISLEEATAVAQGCYIGQQNVNYYLCTDSLQKWTFFADPEPLKGWEHDCRIIYVPKSISEGQLLGFTSIDRRMPPAGNLQPIRFNDFYGAQAPQKPYVGHANLSVADIELAERTFALILSGGMNKNSNNERYWNDCSFIYQTLVKKYGVPRNNICVIMSDGTNPAEDLRTTSGGYISSPLDLDNDGNNDINYSASLININQAFNSFNTKLEEGDHLFVFVIDHGGTNDNNGSSYINLWGNAKLHDFQLAAMLNNPIQKGVNVNVVLGQCFSGGFIDDLTKVGCVVATASAANEYSWGCRDIPYDEFVYQWTCAVNEADANGATIVSDEDNNGRVTMLEAFTYARDNDRAIETPQYVSTPTSIGEDLAFNNRPDTIDLYIKDNPEDTGKEPNLTTDKFWVSPDIWVRNSDDKIEVHENPYYSADHLGSMIYVRVHNRGTKQYNGGQWVHLYWAKASTSFKMTAWKGRELYNGVEVTGGALTPCHIDTIAPGESRIVPIPWGMPPIAASDEDHHFCLLARIMDVSYIDNSIPDENASFDLRGDNGIAQKNVTIIYRTAASKSAEVFVRNTREINKGYSLELVPHSDSDNEVFEYATVNLTMSTPVFNAWTRGGKQMSNVVYAPLQDPKKIKFVSSNGIIKNINLNGNEFEKVTMSFDFHTGVVGLKSYTFDLIQKDEDGNIIGGETFIVEAPLKKFDFPIIINPTELDNGEIELQTNLKDEEQSIKWTDSSGIKIGDKSSLIVAPSSQSKEYAVTVLTNEGELASESIVIDPTKGIKSLSVQSMDGQIEVEFYNNIASSNSFILVSSTTQNIILLNEQIPIGVNKVSLDTSSLANGLYILSYFEGGTLIDSRQFSK